jgi:hypothetical protein
MWRPSYLAVSALCAWFAGQAASSCAAAVIAQLFPLTGEVRLLNRDPTPIPFVFYSITSANESLNGGAVWQSISDRYDASGNGLIDSVEEWSKLSSDPDELTEGVFSGPGGSLPATRAISLGRIWDPFEVPFPDIGVQVWNDVAQIPVSVELAIDGDYTFDRKVDQADYIVWRRSVNSTTMLLADGNLSGGVGTADYDVWRRNFGVTLPLPPYVPGGGGSSAPLAGGTSAVPEPATLALFVLAAVSVLIVTGRVRARRAAPAAALWCAVRQ